MMLAVFAGRQLYNDNYCYNATTKRDCFEITVITSGSSHFVSLLFSVGARFLSRPINSSNICARTFDIFSLSSPWLVRLAVDCGLILVPDITGTNAGVVKPSNNFSETVSIFLILLPSIDSGLEAPRLTLISRLATLTKRSLRGFGWKQRHFIKIIQYLSNFCFFLQHVSHNACMKTKVQN